MDLGPPPVYLVLDYSKDPINKHIFIYPTLKNAIKIWKPGTRVSPIFGITDYGTDQISYYDFEKNQYLLFIGPIHPVRMQQLLFGCKVWLTLGLFNVVVLTESRDTIKKICKEAGKKGVSWEFWVIENSQIKEFQRREFPEYDFSWRNKLAALSDLDLPPELKDAVHEFCPLMASSLCRGTQMSINVEHINKAKDYILRAFDDYKNNEDQNALYPQLGQLLHLNAALSRYSSQTFAGTPPISETECHLWSHSLLGTGVANIALKQFVSYLEQTLGATNIPERFANLCTITQDVPDLATLRYYAPFWNKDHLSEMDGGKELPGSIISYFSARDGFKSALSTLSAPLTALSSCNSFRWSLLTITHEFSHIIIRGVLTELFPDFHDEKAVSNYLYLIDPSYRRENLLDEIRRFFLFSILKMEDVCSGEPGKNYDIDNLSCILESWHHDVEEIMTHVFDFWYFYGREEELYVKSIWISWGTIPNVHSRVQDYVVRTICTVMSANEPYSEASVNLAKNKVVKILKSLQNQHSGGIYVSHALRYIENHGDKEIKEKVLARVNLLRIVKTFLFSEQIATEIRAETQITGGSGKREGYTLHKKHIGWDKIQNPVHFVEKYTDSKKPSFTISVWMFYVLAFCISRENE